MPRVSRSGLRGLRLLRFVPFARPGAGELRQLAAGGRANFHESSNPAKADPLAMLQSDPAHSVDEERYIVLGMSNRRRLLVVAFAERPPRTRLISARRATRKERRQYEEE